MTLADLIDETTYVQTKRSSRLEWADTRAVIAWWPPTTAPRTHEAAARTALDIMVGHAVGAVGTSAPRAVTR
jgi:hypothetical protein